MAFADQVRRDRQLVDKDDVLRLLTNYRCGIHGIHPVSDPGGARRTRPQVATSDWRRTNQDLIDRAAVLRSVEQLEDPLVALPLARVSQTEASKADIDDVLGAISELQATQTSAIEAVAGLVSVSPRASQAKTTTHPGSPPAPPQEILEVLKKLEEGQRAMAESIATIALRQDPGSTSSASHRLITAVSQVNAPANGVTNSDHSATTHRPAVADLQTTTSESGTAGTASAGSGAETPPVQNSLEPLVDGIAKMEASLAHCSDAFKEACTDLKSQQAPVVDRSIHQSCAARWVGIESLPLYNWIHDEAFYAVPPHFNAKRTIRPPCMSCHTEDREGVP
jgi:hypothetical protein